MEKEFKAVSEKEKFITDLQVMVKGYIFAIQMAVADKLDELFENETIRTIVSMGAELKRKQESCYVLDFMNCCKNSSFKMRESVLDYTSSYSNVFNDLVIKKLDYSQYK